MATVKPPPCSISKMPDGSSKVSYAAHYLFLLPINSELVKDMRKALQYMVLREGFVEGIHKCLSVITDDLSLKLGG